MKVVEKSKIAITIGAFLTSMSISIVAEARASDDAIVEYQREIGYQRRVVLEEKKALEKAYTDRDNSVQITPHLRDLIAYGISSGYLGKRFLDNTDNLAAIRRYFKPPQPGLTTAEAAAEAANTAAAVETNANRARLLRNIGSGIMRTAELTGAVVLGLFFVKEIVDTGSALQVRFSDTDEIRSHRERLRVALANLETADQNLQVAIMNSN